ncbi:hypothetical protein Drorol1_Dr00004519 [Drosera rotundifolia]
MIITHETISETQVPQPGLQPIEGVQMKSKAHSIKETCSPCSPSKPSKATSNLKPKIRSTSNQQQCLRKFAKNRTKHVILNMKHQSTHQDLQPKENQQQNKDFSRRNLNMSKGRSTSRSRPTKKQNITFIQSATQSTAFKSFSGYKHNHSILQRSTKTLIL